MSSKSLPAAEIIDDDEDSLAQAYYCAICSHCYVDKPEFVLHLSSSQHHTRNSQLLAALQFGEAYCSLCVVKIEGVFGVHCSTNEDHLQYYKSIERCFLIAPEAALKKKKDGKNKEDKDLSTKKLTGGSSSQASTSFIKTSSKDKIIASRCIGLSHIKRQESQWFCSICLEKFTCSIEVHCNRAIHAIETIKQVDPEIAFMIKSSAAKKNLRKPVNALIASKVEEIYEQEKETADYLRFMLLLDRLEKVVKTEADSNVKEPDFETDISVSSIHEESDINEGGSVTQPLHLPNVDVVPEKADDTEEIVSLFEEEDRNVIPSADKTVPNPREDSSMSESPPVETPIVIGLRFLKKKGLKYYCSLCDVTCKGKTLVSCCRHVSSSLHHRHVINLRSSHPVPDFLFFIRKSNAELYHRLVEAEAKKIEADEIRSGGETELKMRKDLLGVDNVPDNNELSRDEQQPDLVQLARAWYEENNATSAIIEDDESAIVKVQSCVENVLVGVSKVVQVSELEFNCTLCNIKFDIKLNRKEKNHVNGQLHRKKSLIAAYGKSVEDFLELCAKKNGYVKLNRIVNDACVPLENYEMSNETDETKSIRANLLGVKVNQLPVIMLDNRGEIFDIKKAADDFKSSKRIVLSSSTAVCQQEKRSAQASISAPTTISNPSQISALSQISDQCQISAPPQIFDPSQVFDPSKISDQSQISQCESSPQVYDFTNEERSIHTYADSQTFDVQDNAHIKASTKVDTQACDEPSTCIKNIDKFSKGPEPNTTYATVRAVTFNSTTKQLEDNVARDVAVTFNSTTKQLEDNGAREKKLTNKADTCTDTDVVSKPRIPLFSDFENKGISDGNDKGNLSAAITEETHQRETLVEKETTSRPISRKVSFNSNTKVSFKSKNMKRKSPCNSFKEKNNLQTFKESSPPMPRKLMESKGSWDFKALSKTWSTNSNVQPPLKRIPAKERLGKRNYSQKQPSPNQPSPKQTSPTQPPPKQPPPKQPSPNQPPPKQPPPKQPSPNQPPKRPPPKQPSPNQPPPKRLSPKRLSPKSLSNPAHADSKNKRPMGQERHQPRKHCGNPYPMRNQPYVQNSSLDTSNNYKNSEKTADMMAAGPRNLFMESDPKDSIPLPKRNETSQYNGETLSDFNQRSNNNIIPQFSDNRSVNCHTPNTILGINNYPNNYTPTFGLNGKIQANNQECVSFSQNSSNSSNYKNSGQNDMSYMNSGQNDMSYMNSGQNDMSYMNSGQNDMSYMNSGQNDMSYMNSGQNDMSYMNSSQNDMSYMNSGQNDKSYMNSVEQNGQYSTAFGIDLQAMKNTSLTSALAKVTNIAPITKNFQNHIPKQNDPSLYQPAFNNVSNDKQQW